MLRQSLMKSCSMQSMQRGTQAIYKKRLLGRAGNQFGPLHDMSDWVSVDEKQPEPTPKQMKWQKEREQFLNRVVRLAVEADQDAVKNAKKPASIKKHRNRDVDFYFEALEAKQKGQDSIAKLILPEKERTKNWKLI